MNIIEIIFGSLLGFNYMKLRIFFNHYFPEILACIFVILGVFGVLHHDMWRDELQAWMIARNSHSLAELYFNLRYESHPPLWYWLLMLIQRFSLNPISMQWAALSIASMNAWLVLRFSKYFTYFWIFFVL